MIPAWVSSADVPSTSIDVYGPTRLFLSDCVTGDGNKSETFDNVLLANRGLEGSPTCSPPFPPVSKLGSA